MKGEKTCGAGDGEGNSSTISRFGGAEMATFWTEVGSYSTSNRYSPKESSLELTIVGPLALNGFLHNGLLFRIFHPYVSWSLFGGGGCRDYSKEKQQKLGLNREMHNKARNNWFL